MAVVNKVSFSDLRKLIENKTLVRQNYKSDGSILKSTFNTESRKLSFQKLKLEGKHRVLDLTYSLGRSKLYAMA